MYFLVLYSELFRKFICKMSVIGKSLKNGLILQKIPAIPKLNKLLHEN